MKKVLSILGIIILLSTLTGCGGNTARNAVDMYLKKYKTLDSEVLVDLESILEKEGLNDSQKEKYRNILKKQYKDLSYEILEEEYDENVSYVTVKIEVYDLSKAQNDASIYLQNNSEEFNDETGIYDSSKYLDYKLEQMQNMNDRVDYTIIFTVTKENDKYVISQPTENDLKKNSKIKKN